MSSIGRMSVAAATMVSAIKDAIYALVQRGEKSYTVAGRSWTKENLSDLEALLRAWEQRAVAEAGASGNGSLQIARVTNAATSAT